MFYELLEPNGRKRIVRAATYGRGAYPWAVRAVTAAVIAILVNGALAGPAWAVPGHLKGDRLDRAARLTEASLYIVDAVYLQGHRAVRESGLAFAVSPAGHLVAARHVVQKDGRRAHRIVVRQASGPGGPLWVGRVEDADAGSDLAVVRIRARGTPALIVGGSGDAVAAFGRIRGSVVARKGRLGPAETARAPVERMVTRIHVAVRPGESGGPVVDARGHVLGVTLGFFRESGEGFMEPAASVERLLRRSGAGNSEGASGREFREGLSALWHLDLRLAEAHFRAARDAYPEHPLVEAELAAVRRVGDADFRLEGSPRSRGLLAGVGAASGAMAFAFGLTLVARRPRNRLGPDDGEA